MSAFSGKILNGFYHSTSGAMVKFDLKDFIGTRVQTGDGGAYFIIKNMGGLFRMTRPNGMMFISFIRRWKTLRLMLTRLPLL